MEYEVDGIELEKKNFIVIAKKKKGWGGKQSSACPQGGNLLQERFVKSAVH